MNAISKTNIKVGDFGYISASFAPNGATEQSYKLTVADTSVIAFVDDEGEEVNTTDLDKTSKSFKAKGAGSVTVTATSESGLTATIVVNVAAPKLVTSITVTFGNNTIAVGGTTQASVTVNPTDADNKDVTWSSSNTAVATVSSSGKVTGKSGGTAEIIATAKDGSGIVGKATVTVTSDAPAASFPTSLVGQSYTGSDSQYFSTFTYTFVSATEFHMTDDGLMGVDTTFVLQSVDGNTYSLLNEDNDRMTMVINDDGSIIITIELGSTWKDLYTFDEWDITAEQ